MSYKFHIDPGHGWLEVPMHELVDLGIADRISNYSYRDGDTAYLEEDLDFSTFVYAKMKRLGFDTESKAGKSQVWIEFKEMVEHVYHDAWGAPECFIRRLPGYSDPGNGWESEGDTYCDCHPDLKTVRYFG